MQWTSLVHGKHTNYTIIGVGFPLFHFSPFPCTLFYTLVTLKWLISSHLSLDQGTDLVKYLSPCHSLASSGTPVPSCPSRFCSALGWEIQGAGWPQSTSERRIFKACSVKLYLIHLLLFKELYCGQCLVVAYSYSFVFSHKIQDFVRGEDWI